MRNNLNKMILSYRVFTFILYPFLFFFILLRVLLKKEDPKRFKEKILPNYFNVKKTNNDLLWFHAASVGELNSIVPIINRLNKNNNFEFLLTTTTLSSGNLAEEKFKKFNNVNHRYMPYDINYLTNKFLSLWKPKKIFLVDSEIWPNLILNAYKKSIPLALINARLTKKSFRRWTVFPKTSENIFSKFSLCLCANKETKNYLEILKAKNIKYEGNIKFLSEIDENSKNTNNEILSKKKFWVAASIHKDEDLFCLKTHIELKKSFNNVITILAPRHIDRAQRLKAISESMILKAQILNKDDLIFKESEIIIVNFFGGLQNFYKEATSVFMGKSTIKKLINDSGQNPIDPAKLNCKVYHGPYVSNFQEIYDILKTNGISKQIDSFEELSKNLVIDFKESIYNDQNKSNLIKSLEEKILYKTMSSVESFVHDKTV